MLPLSLDWSAPPECPTGQQVEQELRRITRPRPGRVLVPLEARASITRAGEGYHLALELTRNGALSEAHFDSPVCPPLRKAATLVLALAYGDGIEIKEDSSDAGSAAETPPPEPSALEPTKATPRDELAAPQRRERGGEWLRVTPWVAATLTSGFIGDAATGGEAGVTLGGRYFAALARVSAFPPGAAASSGGVSAELSAISGTLGGCAGWPSASVTLEGCIALEAGVLRAHSNGARFEGSANAPWLALNPALALSLPISRPFALRAELGALVPFDAPRFDVTPLGTVYATARVAPRASLGVSVTL